MGKIKKSIVCVCAEQNDIEKCFKPFTLGGSQIPKIRGVVPGSQKRETTPLIISFQGPPPGTTPSKINKYHNFNKLQGQGPPPGTTPKISKIRGWSLTRKNERPPFDNFYIRDHPPNIKDQGWSLARKNERPPPLIISFQGPPP